MERSTHKARTAVVAFAKGVSLPLSVQANHRCLAYKKP